MKGLMKELNTGLVTVQVIAQVKVTKNSWSKAIRLSPGKTALIVGTIATVCLQFSPVIAQTNNSGGNAYGAPGAFGSSIPGSGSSGLPTAGFQNGGYPSGGLQSGGFAGTVNVLQASNYVIGGGYRYGLNGTYLNQNGQQVFLNPLVPYVWPGSRPQYTGDAAFTCRVGNFNCNFWRGSSGYYYPFLSNSFLYAPIIFVGSSASTPQAKLPPPAIQLTDTLKYLDDSNKDKKVAESHYKHLKQRAIDLQRKERSMRIAQGGELDAESEAEIRRDLDGLAKEMSAHVKDH
jgi:hypothetical protein